MSRIAIALVVLSFLHTPCAAQWLPWGDETFGARPSWRHERYGSSEEPARQRSRLRRSSSDGGHRPEIKPQPPPVVPFPHSFPIASIVIDTSGRKLYYVLEGNRAYSYPIAVGRDSFSWQGMEYISRKQAWPDWYPPEEMRQRDPKLPAKMTGGIHNPLGAMALYLGSTLYRIHGTNDPRSIGRAQSSGCFRMMNFSIVHLANLVEVGTNVMVVLSLPGGQEVSNAAMANGK